MKNCTIKDGRPALSRIRIASTVTAIGTGAFKGLVLLMNPVLECQCNMV